MRAGFGKKTIILIASVEPIFPVEWALEWAESLYSTGQHSCLGRLTISHLSNETLNYTVRPTLYDDFVRSINHLPRN